MSKFTFIREESSYVGNAKQTVEFSAGALDDVLAQFEDFLKGAGFVFDGRLEIVKINNDESALYNSTNVNDINLDISQYGAAQAHYEFPEYTGFNFSLGEDTITLSEPIHPQEEIDIRS